MINSLWCLKSIRSTSPLLIILFNPSSSSTPKPTQCHSPPPIPAPRATLTAPAIQAACLQLTPTIHKMTSNIYCDSGLQTRIQVQSKRHEKLLNYFWQKRDKLLGSARGRSLRSGLHLGAKLNVQITTKRLNKLIYYCDMWSLWLCKLIIIISNI